jgi:hypothetical protein
MNFFQIRPGLFFLLLAGCAGCAPATAPTAARGEPPRAPTLAVSFDYSPALTLLLRLDGQPVEGPLDLCGVLPEGAEITRDPGNPGLALDESSIHLVAHGGRVQLEPGESRKLGGYARQRIRIGTVELPLPHLGASDPFACADALLEASQPDPCISPPPPEEIPPTCDSRGAEVWLATRARREQDFARCWRQKENAGRLATIKDAAVRQRACEAMEKSQGDRLDDELGATLHRNCVDGAFKDGGKRVKLAWLRYTLPGALGEVGSSNEELRAFYRKYSATGDPRVEQLRELARERFGPLDHQLFLSMKTEIEKLVSFHQHHVELCSLGADGAEYSIIDPPRRLDPAHPPRRVSPDEDFASEVTLLPPPPRGLPRPDLGDPQEPWPGRGGAPNFFLRSRAVLVPHPSRGKPLSGPPCARRGSAGPHPHLRLTSRSHHRGMQVAGRRVPSVQVAHFEASEVPVSVTLPREWGRMAASTCARVEALVTPGSVAVSSAWSAN